MKNLKTAANRVAMVSGANRGIGLAVARRLRDDGYRLSLGMRSLDSLPAEFSQSDEVQAARFDATDRRSAQDWVEAVRTRFGAIDVLVNNAGVLHPFAIDDEDETGLDQMWEVNLKGPLRLTRAAWPELRKCGHGRVINIVSLSGLRVKGEAIGGYAMTKFAASALTQTTRYAGWEHGIRATAICPGYVATDMTASGADIGQSEMLNPESIAHLVSMVLALPNPASVVEIPVNCVLEPMV